MILTKVDKIEELSGGLDLCFLEFDGGKDSAYIIWNYTNMLQYLEGEVIATFRQDMYKGVIQKFVNTLARVGVVHTLERDDNIKLYVDKPDNQCSISFKDIPEGNTMVCCTVYVIAVENDSSARATWVDFTIQDRDRKLAKLRMFNPSTNMEEFVGRYIMCDIRHNKYGFSTESVVTVDATFPYSPEVAIAEDFILKTFADDKEVLGILDNSGFLKFGKRNVTEEPGYILVRLAMELDYANELANLTKEVDIKMVRRALLFNKFSILNEQSPYHSDIVKYAMASRFKFDGSREVLMIEFSDAPEYAKERVMFNSIREFIDNVIKIKKGLV